MWGEGSRSPVGRDCEPSALMVPTAPGRQLSLQGWARGSLGSEVLGPVCVRDTALKCWEKF